jgi:hypothetical protein
VKLMKYDRVYYHKDLSVVNIVGVSVVSDRGSR